MCESHTLYVFLIETSRMHWLCRDVVKMIYRQDGLTGYFRGLTTTWARDIPGYFIFFTAKFVFHQGLDRTQWRISGEISSVCMCACVCTCMRVCMCASMHECV